MRPDLGQWVAIIFATLLGLTAGGWFLLFGPAALSLVVAHNRHEMRINDGSTDA